MLNGLFKRISSSGPSQKYPASESASVKEQQAKGETYKIIIRLPPAVPALVTFEINRPEFIHEINPKLKLQYIEEIYNYIDELDIRPSHMTICAAVCKKILHIRDVQYIDYITIKKLVAISTCCLLDWGLPAVADFISAIPKERNLSVLMSTGTLILPIEPALMDRANKKYSVIGSADSLITLKDNLIKELICNDWIFKFGKIENFGNEIFELMLRD